jgi:LysM repeat protein
MKGPKMRTLAVLPLALAALLASSEGARADVQHVVARGHTLEAIAHRYHVTVQSIVDANHLKDARHLKVGETLTIPGVQAPAASVNAKKGPDGKPIKPVSYAMQPKTPDVVHVTRLASGEEYTLHVNARRGKISPTVAQTAEQMMRSMAGLSHPVEPRLVHLLAAHTPRSSIRRTRTTTWGRQ